MMNLIGHKFGKLVVTSFSHVKNTNSYWKCKCDCGNLCTKSGNAMKTGNVRSCGCLKVSKRPKGETGLRILFNTYYSRARSRNIVFNLSLEDVKNITSQNCFYCGVPPQFIASSKLVKSVNFKNYNQYIYNGIDRIDSTRGYTKDNVVPCCKWCNIAKNNKSISEFKEHIKKIYDHLI